MNSSNTTDITVASTLGADINGLVLMCHLFGFVKEVLQERGFSTESAMSYDTDTVVQKERLSDDDCDDYRYLIRSGHYDECVDNYTYSSMLNLTNPDTAQKHTYPPLGNLLGMQMETY